MNAVRRLRSYAGVTQQVLAQKAGTSQPTIALYESGAKSPSISTLQRLASSLECDLVVTYVPRLTREDRRSLAYHHAIANVLRENPGPAIRRAKRTLSRMRKIHPEADSLCVRWRGWLGLPTGELIDHLLDAGMGARDMRHVTPFAGLLSPKERVRILHRFRKEEGQ